MSDAYIIEIGDEAVGIIARETRGYRFYAAKNSFRALEARVFDSVKLAQSAVLDFRRQSSTTPAPLLARIRERARPGFSEPADLRESDGRRSRDAEERSEF